MATRAPGINSAAPFPEAPGPSVHGLHVEGEGFGVRGPAVAACGEELAAFRVLQKTPMATWLYRFSKDPRLLTYENNTLYIWASGCFFLTIPRFVLV